MEKIFLIVFNKLKQNFKQKKRILDDEDNFCSSETLKEVLDCKVCKITNNLEKFFLFIIYFLVGI